MGIGLFIIDVIYGLTDKPAPIFQKNEKADMNEHIRSLLAAKDGLQGRVNKLEKTEGRLKEELERSVLYCQESFMYT